MVSTRRELPRDRDVLGTLGSYGALASEEVPMTYVLAALVLLPLLALVVAALTGRVRVQSCCAISDASRDLRMRAAFEDSDTR